MNEPVPYVAHITSSAAEATVTVDHPGGQFRLTAPADTDVRVGLLRRLRAEAATHGIDIALSATGDLGEHQLLITRAGVIGPLAPSEEVNVAPALTRPAAESVSFDEEVGATVFSTRRTPAENAWDVTEISRGHKPEAVLHLPDGAQLRILRPVTVGRATRASDGRATAQLVDPTGTVSRTHLYVEPRADGVVIVDLGSANGTAVDDGHGHTEDLAPHVPYVFGDGTRLVLGDLPIIIRTINIPARTKDRNSA